MGMSTVLGRGRAPDGSSLSFLSVWLTTPASSSRHARAITLSRPNARSPGGLQGVNCRKMEANRGDNEPLGATGRQTARSAYLERFNLAFPRALQQVLPDKGDFLLLQIAWMLRLQTKEQLPEKAVWAHEEDGSQICFVKRRASGACGRWTWM